ncbi:MAG: hypothetical protein R3E53_14930 [Myxococcota bacterium]
MLEHQGFNRIMFGIMIPICLWLVPRGIKEFREEQAEASKQQDDGKPSRTPQQPLANALRLPHPRPIRRLDTQARPTARGRRPLGRPFRFQSSSFP